MFINNKMQHASDFDLNIHTMGISGGLNLFFKKILSLTPLA